MKYLISGTLIISISITQVCSFSMILLFNNLDWSALCIQTLEVFPIRQIRLTAITVYKVRTLNKDSLHMFSKILI